MARPPLGSAYIYVLIAFTSYTMADLSILYFRDQMIPLQAPPERPRQFHNQALIAKDNYSVITSKNIFSFDGKIPDPIGAGKKQEPVDDLPPQKTQISGLQLIGTLVHTNPNKSVASVKAPNSGDAVNAFHVGETINGVGEVLAIERGRLLFRNIISRRKEYVDLPQDSQINLGISKNQSPSKQVGEVTVVNDMDRMLKRDDVLRLTSNLPEILQQARAIKDGNGFRIVDIQPGSIYERLGLKRGDLILSVNGEAVDSPQKAMELYNTLKSSRNIGLGIERNGRPETLNFTIQ